MRRPHPRVAVVAALCLLSVGCGSRLTTEQRDFVLRVDAGSGGRVPVAGRPGQPVAGPSASTAPGTAGPSAGPVGVPGAGPRASRSAAPVAGGGGNGGTAAGPACAVAGGTGGRTDVGVAANELTIANVTDVSGPLPGLFESVRQATTAFTTYWNATYGGICGRRLKLLNYDSRTDANGHREAYLKACDSSFAVVGAMSAFDHGGAGVMEKCGIVDVAAVQLTPEHQSVPNSYGAAGQRVGTISSTLPRFIESQHPGAVSKAAYLYVDAGAGAIYAQANIRAYEAYGRGWKFVYVEGIDVSTFNYAPYVQKMKDNGVRYVQFLGAYQQAAKLRQAMADQGFEPDMFLTDATVYNKDFIKQGGASVEGTYAFTDAAMFEDAPRNPEVALYIKWLAQVAPGAEPTYYGLLAWSAARLFVTEAAAVGPRLTRKALLDRLKVVDGWTANGLTAPQHVGRRMTPECWAFLQIRDGKWHRAHPASGADYACNPLTSG